MAFNEKSAWVMTIALVVGAISYYSTVADLSATMGALAPPVLPSIVKFTVVIVVIAIIGHIVIAVLSPKDADDSRDERERRIVDRAGHLSGYVFGAGVITALGVYLFQQDGRVLFYGVFTSLLLAQIIEYLVQIFLFRFGVR